MNMQSVNINNHGFCCTCCKCGRILGARGKEKEPRFADLDGPSFEAYYCTECAEGAKPNKSPEVSNV